MLRRWREEISKHEGYLQGYLAPVPPDKNINSCHCYKGMGFLRKRSPYDCGNPRCTVCHFDKYYNKKNRNNIKRKAIKQDMESYI